MKKTILMMAAVLCSHWLMAQEDSTSLDQVTVTATRFPKKLSETGKVVTIITREDLAKAGGKELPQLLNEQTGIIINGAGSNPGKDKSVYIRGANYNYTVILINGVPVIDPTGVGGAFDLRMLPVDQIQRIEILKGAQSTLYGSDAVAGVINIITRKGSDVPARLYGGLSYGTQHTLRAHTGLNGSLGASSYNISFVHNETRGISEAKDTMGTQHFPTNGMLQNAVSADLDGAISDALHIKPFFRYSYFTGSYSPEAFKPGEDRFRASLMTAGSQASYTFSKGTLTGLFSYDEVARRYPDGFIKEFNGSKKTAEVFSRYDLHPYFQTLLGLRYDEVSMEQPNATTPDTSSKIISPYLSLFLRNLGGFNFEAGGRLTNHSKYGNNFTYTLNPSYLINDEVKLFVNFGTAFRAPALSELFGLYGANPNLKPEESQTLEGGIQFTATDKKIDARITGFMRNTKNIIAYVNNRYTNYNRQKDHGFELEATLRPVDPLTVKLFYAFTEGEVTTANSNNNGDTTYNNLFRRPKSSLGAHIGYQVLPAFYISTNINYYGSRQDLDFSTYPSLTVPLKAYTLWDLYAEYSFLKQKLRAFVQVTNLLDADYYETYGYSVWGRAFNAGIRFQL